MAATVAALDALTASRAHAHFVLSAPACYSVQDAVGAPLKSGPCGQADPGQPLVPTHAVTTFRPGQTITVTVKETVFHPGFYRVAIAPDLGSLPADPPVMAGASACGSTVIDPHPALPVLADGLLSHTTAFNGPQSVQVTLPANFTCDSCVLQVTEFMSSHGLNNPGGCFYHHCAMVSIVPPVDAGSGVDAGAAADAAVDVSGQALMPPATPAGGCQAAQGSSHWAELFNGLGLCCVLMLLRRRC
jgi:hypothetical protein